jgi:GT2 family glycosyltransferase
VSEGDVPRISVVVPTYRRERVLIETLGALWRQLEPTDELLVIDQTEQHDSATQEFLVELDAKQAIRWIQQRSPSITAAMNRGLLEARCDVVLFVDDDIAPKCSLMSAHRLAHAVHPNVLVAGRVIQPWEVDGGRSNPSNSTFAGVEPAWVDEFMGGNFSVRRADALNVGGFDENFVQVAYRYEAEFASRFRAAGGRIRFEPRACLHHLRTARGGTRAYGEHLTTVRPSHSVGAYYFALRTHARGRWLRECVTRPLRAIATRHHLRGPWWIPVTLAAELRGMWWAICLHRAGPRLIGTRTRVS